MALDSMSSCSEAITKSKTINQKKLFKMAYNVGTMIFTGLIQSWAGVCLSVSGIEPSNPIVASPWMQFHSYNSNIMQAYTCKHMVTGLGASNISNWILHATRRLVCVYYKPTFVFHRMRYQQVTTLFTLAL